MLQSMGRKESDMAELLNLTELRCLTGKELPAKISKFNPWVRKIPLEKEMATHSSILAWEVPGTEEQTGYSPLGYKDCQTKFRDLTACLCCCLVIKVIHKLGWYIYQPNLLTQKFHKSNQQSHSDKRLHL